MTQFSSGGYWWLLQPWGVQLEKKNKKSLPIVFLQPLPDLYNSLTVMDMVQILLFFYIFQPLYQWHSGKLTKDMNS